MSLVTRYRTALASPGIPGGAGGPFLPLAGGDMAGALNMVGNPLTIDADKDSIIDGSTDDIISLEPGGVTALQVGAVELNAYKRLKMRGAEISFSASNQGRIKWDTTESVPLFKLAAPGIFYLGPSGDMGVNRANGAAPSSGILWRANDTTFANHVSSRHEGGNAYFNKGDAAGEFRWQIGGVSYIALDSTGPRVQMKQDLRFDVGCSIDFVGSADLNSTASNATLNAAAGSNVNLSVGGAPFLVANGGSNEIQCNRQLDLNGNTFKANTSSDVILPRIHDAASEPTLTDGEMRIWWDTALTKLWLIVRRSGTQYKVELK